MRTILVIDDDKPVLETVREILAKFGYKVETAADGKEGIQKFDDGDFDLVITDIRMPGINGTGVAQHIRNSDRHFTPVIGISGTPWLLQGTDFDAVLPKPFQIKTLIESVKKLVTTP